MSALKAPKLDPTALPLEEVSRVLSKISVEPLTVEQLEEDLDAGAPTNADGTLNLVRYAAWLLSEMKRGD
jgi:hypothetical protein